MPTCRAILTIFGFSNNIQITVKQTIKQHTLKLINFVFIVVNPSWRKFMSMPFCIVGINRAFVAPRSAPEAVLLRPLTVRVL